MKLYFSTYRYASKLLGIEIHTPKLDLDNPKRKWQAYYITIAIMGYQVQIGIIDIKLI